MSYTGKIIKIINKGNGSNVILLTAIPDFPENSELREKLPSPFVPVLGHCFSPNVGDFIDFEGALHNSKEHGLQLYANFIHPHIHDNGKFNGDLLRELLAEAFSAYEADAVIPLLPQKAVKKLYFEAPLSSETPADKAVAKALRVVRRAREIAPRFNYLKSLGVSNRSALYASEYFGSGLERLISNNPFRLYHVPSFDHRDVDKAAKSLNIEGLSPYKRKAVIQMVVDRLESSGHTCFSLEQFIETGAKLLGDKNSFLESLSQELHKKNLVLIEGTNSYFVTTAAAFRREKLLYAKLKRLMEPNNGFRPLDSDGLDDTILNPAQKNAVNTALKSPLCIITGGAGTGKTTTLNEFIKQVKSQSSKEDFSIVACSPTGKAAVRLKEATNTPAYTVHDLLGYNPQSGQFKYGDKNYLPYDVVIVDEATMADTDLFLHLVSSVRPGARLVLVGDHQQLPSVGPGAVLRDCIDSNFIQVARLTKTERTASLDSLITENANAIVAGKMPVLDDNSRDFHFIPASSDQQIEELVKRIAKQLSQRHGVSLKDIQVLSPQSSTRSGVQSLNKALKPIFNPCTSGKLSIFGKTFHVGDRVMQTKNDKTSRIQNGESCYIDSVDYKKKLVTVTGDFGVRNIPFKDFGTFEHALCCTIHKSQGSEYPVVIIPVSMSHKRMLNRQLLYTATTRGKSKVYFVGNKEAVGHAVNNNDSMVRHTLLSMLFKNPDLKPVSSIKASLLTQDDRTCEQSQEGCALDNHGL